MESDSAVKRDSIDEERDEEKRDVEIDQEIYSDAEEKCDEGRRISRNCWSDEKRIWKHVSLQDQRQSLQQLSETLEGTLVASGTLESEGISVSENLNCEEKMDRRKSLE